MGELTRWVDPATERQITQALARHLGSMELATRVTKAGMSEVGRTQVYAAKTVATTLRIVDHEVQAAGHAGRLTPAKQEAVHHLTEAYLSEMLGITHDAGAEIAELLLRR